MPRAAVLVEAAPSSLASSAPSSVILLAAADREVRALCHQALVDDGHLVVDAIDGRDALIRAFQTPGLELVVTASHLPFLDGYSLCDVLRTDRETAALPVLIVIGTHEEPDMDRARLVGARGMVVGATTPEPVVREARILLSGMRWTREPDPAALRPGDHDRRAQSKSMARFSSRKPPLVPLSLVCPSCNAALVYALSHVGGVSRQAPEQWDYFTCPSGCGAYQYRQRTRTLRAVDGVPTS